MKQISPRNFVKTFDCGAWNLNLHVIFGDEYTYVIDTGLGSGSIAALGSLPDKPVVVINTHHHWDHIWGNHCFPNSMILAHRSCYDLAQAHWDEMLEQNGKYIQGSVARALPNLLFEQELHFPADDIHIFHTPGHTVDGISVFDARDKVLNAGDNIGDDMDDLLPSLETDAATFLATLDRYEALEFTQCVSGHNQVIDRAVLAQLRTLALEAEG